jgi:hypothetical protein
MALNCAITDELESIWKKTILTTSGGSEESHEKLQSG